MGNFLSSLKASEANNPAQTSTGTKLRDNLFEKQSESETTTPTASRHSTQQESNSPSRTYRLFNKKHKDTKTPKLLKMSVILQPTVKQTASVIFLHGLGDTGLD